ncbi:hypothetical protein CIC12_04645 [Burkholderia sp. SG-MS1]|nr:hypothetical protein [Paraburkholderia sp. SG-MS1]
MRFAARIARGWQVDRTRIARGSAGDARFAHAGAALRERPAAMNWRLRCVALRCVPALARMA